MDSCGDEKTPDKIQRVCWFRSDLQASKSNSLVIMILLLFSSVTIGSQLATVSASGFDFSLANSGGISIGSAGGSGSNTITVSLVSGTTQPVALSVTGLPTGATPGFSGGVGCGNQPTCTISPPSMPLLTIFTTSSTPTGCYFTQVTGVASGGLTHSTMFTLGVGVGGFGYVLSNSGDISVGSPGGSGSNTINVGLCGTTQSVTLSASGFPPGANGLFNAGVSGCINQTSCIVSPPASPALSISTMPSTPTGTFPITVTGMPMASKHSTTFSLNVGVAGFDFSLSNTGDISIGSPGGSGSNTINVGLVNGPTHPVTLIVSPLPNGATAGFSGGVGCSNQQPCTVSPPSSPLLTIFTTGSTPPGCYSIAVVGTSGSLTHTTMFDLRVAVTLCMTTSSTQVISDATNTVPSGSEVTGSSFHDTAAVTGISGLTPTGSLVYSFFNNGGCSGTAATTEMVTLSGGTVPPSSSTSPLPAGSYSFNAQYAGDSNYQGSMSVCEPFIVNPGPPMVCITSSPVAVTCPTTPAHIGPVSVGSTFTIGVFVQDSAPMGGIMIYVKSDPMYLNPVAAALSTLIASQSFPDICINSFAPNDGTCGPGDPGGIGPGYANGPGVVMAEAIEGSGLNECSGLSVCSGMAFTITYRAMATTSGVDLAFPTAPGCFVSSVASPANVCVLVADAGGNALSENIQGATVTVSPAASSTATIVYDASAGLPWSGAEVTGSSAYDTATVSGVNGINPTGNVVYTFFTNNACSGTGAQESPVGGSLLIGGVVPISSIVGPLASGSYSFKATYGGDLNYLASTSPCEPFSVGKADTRTPTCIYLWPNGGPLCPTDTVSLGDTVFDSAIVGNTFDQIPPTGNVAYTFFTNGACSGTGSEAGTSSTFVHEPGGGFLAGGSSSEGPLAAGSYSFQATYSGDSNYVGSTSDCELLTVNKASTTTTLFLTETYKAYYLNGTAYGYTWTIPSTWNFATLGALLKSSSNVGTQIDGFVIGGTMTYSWAMGSYGVGQPAPDFGGPGLAAGTACATATYSGDSNYASSSVTICFPVTIPMGGGGSHAMRD